MLVLDEKTPSVYLNAQISAAEQEKQTLVSHHINLFPGNAQGTAQIQGWQSSKTQKPQFREKISNNSSKGRPLEEKALK